MGGSIDERVRGWDRSVKVIVSLSTRVANNSGERAVVDRTRVALGVQTRCVMDS